MKTTLKTLPLFLALGFLAYASNQALAQENSPWNQLSQASSHARVGNSKTCLDHLKKHDLRRHPNKDVQLSAQLIEARAHIENNQPQKALKALGSLSQTRDSAIVPIVALIELRAAVLMQKNHQTLVAAEKLINAIEVPQATLIEARKHRAAVWSQSGDEKQKKRAISELKKLVKLKAARTLRPEIVEMLSTVVSKSQKRSYHVQLLVNHGGSEPGRRAMKKLNPSSLSKKQKWRRVDQLMIVWANDLAENTLQELQRLDDEEGQQKAALMRATIRMRMRVEYPEALNLLKSACKGPDKEMADEAWYRRGLILGNLKKWTESVSTMQRLIRRKPTKRLLKRAAYQVGRLQHQAGKFTQAAPAIKHFVDGVGKGEDTWQWFIGWAHFRAGKYEEARSEWKKLLTRRNLLVGPKALYWTARSYLLENKKKEAKAKLKKLAKKAPHGYYGLLGAALYAQEFQKGSSPWPPRPERFPLVVSSAVDLIAKTKGSKNKALRSDVRSIQIRSATGFPEMAREVANAEDLERKLLKNLSFSKMTAQRRASEEQSIRDGLTFWLELWGKQWRKHARKRLAWAGGLHHFDDETVKASLPPSYLNTARAAGAMHKVSPWWLIAHMLQESRYKESAISHAGALGAMQILPITGRHIAREAGFPKGDFSAGRLFESGVSLRQAAWYLAALREEFGMNTLMAIASYNGGPRRMSEYLTGDNSKLPMDEFIEEIGAHETRNYVRKVTDHLVRYVTIYASDQEREEILNQLIPPPKLPTPKGKVRF